MVTIPKAILKSLIAFIQHPSAPGISALALLLFSVISLNPAPLFAAPEDRWKAEWPKTDFSRRGINFEEIISGGPPKDGIPPIDQPKFVSVSQAAKWLDAEEPVLAYQQGAEAKAYPLQILIWHEIVNDTVGGRPVLITYCPLCSSALVFDRRLDGQVLDFGTTGKLRNSDLVMWDRQTESWWQQLTGDGIVGKMTGKQLTFLAGNLVSFSTFQQAFPQGKVLSRDTGHSRNYGGNPYAGYDSPDNTQPFLFRNKVDSRLPATERVVTLEIGGEARAYAYALLREKGVYNDTVGGQDVAVFFHQGTRSSLDSSVIRQSKAVGTGTVFNTRLEGKKLIFEHRDGAIRDKQTGSRWNLFGQATNGPLKGKTLRPVLHGNHFAFAWLSFRPQSKVIKGP